MISLCRILLFVTSFGCLMAADDKPKVSSETALRWLKEGNKRYAENHLLHPNRSAETRVAVSMQQTPFATILGCSDSRASPEIIFDQGIGDLFVVRVAGNVAGDIETDSIDFSALYLGSSVILVLGHQNCGAINAVLNKKTKDIETIAKLIQPAILTSKDLESAIKANVLSVVKQLRTSAVISRLIQENKVNVVGGYYNFQTGLVEFLED